ncbi:MAG: cyanophycinase [Bacteroidales bacterium]
MNKARQTNKGNLILIGGSEDRLHRKEVLRNLVETHQAQNIIVIPSATLYPFESGDDYCQAFQSLGVKNVNIFDIRNNHQANNSYPSDVLEQADLVFFTGGDPLRLTSILHQSLLFNHIRYRYLYEQLPLAGSSAGALVFADLMVCSTGREIAGGFESVTTENAQPCKGFGFIADFAIDTHFSSLEKMHNLLEFCCRNKITRAVGIEHDTSMTIHSDNTFSVAGSGSVSLFSGSPFLFSHKVGGHPAGNLSMDGIRMSILRSGDSFDMGKWSVKNDIRVDDMANRF